MLTDRSPSYTILCTTPVLMIRPWQSPRAFPSLFGRHENWGANDADATNPLTGLRARTCFLSPVRLEEQQVECFMCKALLHPYRWENYIVTPDSEQASAPADGMEEPKKKWGKVENRVLCWGFLGAKKLHQLHTRDSLHSPSPSLSSSLRSPNHTPEKKHLSNQLITCNLGNSAMICFVYHFGVKSTFE